ncbi:nuclease-related domain-containing protein [Salinisphaera sp. T31B1]|uniref:nuclease-related domain-containing protein n=1 Tax=Salinisphaera sp. T31B1 TaxID=727963 RepID=UPI00333E2110
MITQFGVLAGALAIISPPFFMVIVQLRWNEYQDKRTGRRHPLTRGMLRPPGHELSEKRRSHGMDAMYCLALGPLFGFITLATALGIPYFRNEPVSDFLVALAIITVLAASIYSGFRLRRIFRELQAYRLGWEGEVATAEELNKLMRDGFEVFHDLPCGRFNIDHVVIGPTGVFAVETKARSKQKRSDTAENDYTARFDGRTINFAGWQDRKCLEQAKRQAQWLSEWLSSATGEPTVATPAIAIPGWKVDRVKGSNQQPVRVFTPREAKSLVRTPTAQPLDHAAIKRITHQIEQKCRQDLVEKTGKK